AYWPMIWSITALIPRIGHVGEAWVWRTRVGGREPSGREREAYEQAIHTLQGASDDPLPLPKDWFVIDIPGPEAAVCGHTLMLSRPVLEHPQLPAVLAHELGHLAKWDARLTAALNRLVIQRWPSVLGRGGEEGPSMAPLMPAVWWVLGPLALIVWLTRKAYTSCRGGLGLWLLKPLWANVWRQGEFDADQYAAQLGQAEELAEFLEYHALELDQPMPFTWLSDYTHPPTALRIDRLRSHARTLPERAPAPAPAPTTRTVLQEELPGFEGQPALRTT
ncbi:MAG TPA: M48 family metalloprotease, partial [Solirubrobacteraceae bacterium]